MNEIFILTNKHDVKVIIHEKSNSYEYVNEVLVIL